MDARKCVVAMSQLSSYVLQHGHMMSRDTQLPFCVYAPCTDEVVRLVRGFASNWKGSIESLNHDVMRQFTNFRNGTSILQVGMQQFIA